MSTNAGSRVTATGLAFILLAVIAGVSSGDTGQLICLVGVLIGANAIAVGIFSLGEELAPTARHYLGDHTAFLRGNLAFVGLIMAASGITAVAGAEAGPVLCFPMLALLLLGLCFVNIHILGK